MYKTSVIENNFKEKHTHKSLSINSTKHLHEALGADSHQTLFGPIRISLTNLMTSGEFPSQIKQM